MTKHPEMIERWEGFIEYAKSNEEDGWILWSEFIRDFPSSVDDLKNLDDIVERGARAYSYVARTSLLSDVIVRLNYFLGFTEYWALRGFPPAHSLYRKALKLLRAVVSSWTAMHPDNIYDHRMYLVSYAARSEGLNLDEPLRNSLRRLCVQTTQL